MAKLFGTDGIRGVSNQAPMDSETALNLGRAAAHVFSKQKGKHRILIGKDTRLSGYMLETALESGITSMGVDTYLLGPLPTPGIAFMVRSMRADAGIMISASHNPYQDNGIKFFAADGFKLDDSVEKEIEDLVSSNELISEKVSPDNLGKAYRIDDALGRYTVYLKSCIEPYFKLDGLKLVVDTANGAAYRVAPLVFSELGADLITIGDRPNGKNINAYVGSLYPEVVSQLVKEKGADCGISFDGDADRVIFSDEQGNIVNGDQLLAILALDFKSSGKLKNDAVVGTVMSNLGLEDALRKEGISLHRSKVGDRYVLAEMLSHNLNLGGEQSGHLISLDHNTTGDGVLTALLILNALRRSGKKLSELASIVKKYPQELINIEVAEKKSFDAIPSIVSARNEAKKELADKGRLLLRYSGTENLARVMVECSSQELCSEVANSLAGVIKKELG